MFLFDCTFVPYDVSCLLHVWLLVVACGLGLESGVRIGNEGGGAVKGNIERVSVGWYK